MSLGDRIQIVLCERNVTQVEFARSLGISANYVNLLANGKKKNISDTLANLIEERYGYSARWILDGCEPKMAVNCLTADRAEIIKKIQKMSDSEVRAVLAFVNTLGNMKEK